jgi:hypothetical protein
MNHLRLWRGLPLFLLAGLLTAPLLAQQAPRPVGPAQLTTPPRLLTTPRLEPVAETRLLMEGMTNANYRGLDRLLKQRPTDVETWTFGRGQALLIAESANLLLLRPPRNAQGEKAWMQLATDMRDEAGAMARAMAARDYTRSVATFTTLTSTCNRCHQTFRIPQRIAPSTEPGNRREVE